MSKCREIRKNWKSKCVNGYPGILSKSSLVQCISVCIIFLSKLYTVFMTKTSLNKCWNTDYYIRILHVSHHDGNKLVISVRINDTFLINMEYRCLLISRPCFFKCYYVDARSTDKSCCFFFYLKTPQNNFFWSRS